MIAKVTFYNGDWCVTDQVQTTGHGDLAPRRGSHHSMGQIGSNMEPFPLWLKKVLAPRNLLLKFSYSCPCEEDQEA